MKALATCVGQGHEKDKLMNWNHDNSTDSTDAKSRHSRRATALLVLLGLAGCGLGLGDRRPGNTAGDSAEPTAEAPPSPPAGAIPVSPDLYMLPMGTDSDGCALFQPWSPTMAVVQALHWRTADGRFTLDRSRADCP